MLAATAGRCVRAVVLPWLAPTGRTLFTGSGREPTRSATVQLPAVLRTLWWGAFTRDAVMTKLAGFSTRSTKKPLHSRKVRGTK
jgi:hypothetical protein